VTLSEFMERARRENPDLMMPQPTPNCWHRWEATEPRSCSAGCWRSRCRSWSTPSWHPRSVPTRTKFWCRG